MTTADPTVTPTTPGTFELFHEDRNAHACRPHPNSTITGREISDRIAPDDDAREIYFTEHRFKSFGDNKRFVRFHLWPHDWDAVQRAPELFAGLARLSARLEDGDAAAPTIESVTALLIELGFADTTEREPPVTTKPDCNQPD